MTTKTQKANDRLYRQGDVLFLRVEALPEGAVARASDVIVEGEVTGHAHRLVGGEVCVVGATATAAMMFLVCAAAAQVVHEEHHTVTLPAGVYRVVRQREYSPEAIRTVAD